MTKTLFVISHTHWDREWYLPFEQFRMRLVDMVDNLLDVLDEYPDYVFHLDAQTIILEDYLEIRPSRRELLAGHIRGGRILVGPWYVQNDFFLTSGEATIRNLLIGSEIAEEFGRCTWIGYAPDQFGLISQLPQILSGFGIDNCIFGRGYSFHSRVDGNLTSTVLPAEFYWAGADGSRLIAVHMPFWYNNAQRFSRDIDKALGLVEMIVRDLDGIALTPNLLLMNGVDHLEAQEDLLPIIEALNERLPESVRICQSTMERYIEKVKEYLESGVVDSKPATYHGELRNGTDRQVLQGTLSSRVYVKTANARAQNFLENQLEPLYAFIHMSGARDKYPEDYMRYLWKLLIQNHPHDSICGCSRDEVHAHMEDRFARLNETAGMLLERGMEFLTDHVSREGMERDEYLVSIFNTIETMRSGVVELNLDFPVEEKVDSFRIMEEDGIEADFAILSSRTMIRDMFSVINLPGTIQVDSFRVRLLVREIPGLSHRTYTVSPRTVESVAPVPSGPDIPAEPVMENSSLKVLVGPDGKIGMINKNTGRFFKDILHIEDTEDCGDSYAYVGASDGRTVSSRDFVPTVSCARSDRLGSTYLLTYELPLPECFDRDAGCRSPKTVANRVEVTLELNEGSPFLEVTFRIDNASRDHRLRAVVDTGFPGDVTAASSPFDVVLRNRRDVLDGIRNGTQPNSGFVSIDGHGEGIAVLNRGLYEYEHLMDDRGAIALTLLRSNGRIVVSAGGDAWLAPGNQCLRRLESAIAIYPYEGSFLEGKVALVTKQFQNPLLSCFQSVDTKKFSGGRPAVQDTSIGEIFYRPDSHPRLQLPRSGTFVEVKGDGIVLSALKKGERDASVVLRVYNSLDKETMFELNYIAPIESAWRTDMREEQLEELRHDGTRLLPVRLKPKEILTLSLRGSVP